MSSIPTPCTPPATACAATWPKHWKASSPASTPHSPSHEPYAPTSEQAGQPRPAQRLPRLPARTRYRCRPPAGPAAVQGSRQHDRPVRRAAALANVNAAACPQRDDSTGRLLRAVEGRSAGRQQVAGRAIDQPPAGHPGHGQGADRPPGLRCCQPEQDLRPDSQLRRQPGPLQYRG